MTFRSAIRDQGTLAERPENNYNLGVRHGRFYHATDVDRLYYDAGHAWYEVGREIPLWDLPGSVPKPSFWFSASSLLGWQDGQTLRTSEVPILTDLPLLHSHATGVTFHEAYANLNGQPAVRLPQAGQLRWRGFGGRYSSCTIVVVYYVAANGSGDGPYPISFVDLPTSNPTLVVTSSSAIRLTVNGSNITGNLAHTWPDKMALSVNWDGSATVAYRDNVQFGSTSLDLGIQDELRLIGTTNQWGGGDWYVADVMFWEPSLTSQQRADLQAALATRYAL